MIKHRVNEDISHGRDGLACDEGIRAGLLFPPGWYKHCDVFVATFKEPVHRELNALAGENLFVAVAAR